MNIQQWLFEIRPLFEEYPFLVTCLSSGLTFICSALVMKWKPPKRINAWYGYRTKKSRSSKERWEFAQKFSADVMLWMGIALSVIGLADLLIKMDVLLGVFLSIFFVTASSLLLTVIVEQKLKQIK